MNRSHSTLADFVRDGLGCGCPASVLERIEVVAVPEPLCRWGKGRLLEVGNRLLVLILTDPDWRPLASGLPDLFEAGRALRDAEGWNRFRLVIATTDPRAGDVLVSAFSSLELPDDRLHLHVVSPQTLPAPLSSGGC